MLVECEDGRERRPEQVHELMRTAGLAPGRRHAGLQMVVEVPLLKERTPVGSFSSDLEREPIDQPAHLEQALNLGRSWDQCPRAVVAFAKLSGK